MIPTEGASGSILAPPPAVSPAAWPHDRSLRVWIAANCERCDDCDATREPSQPCLAKNEPKKRA